MWVIDSHVWDTRPTTRDEFVAWPAPGYVPHQVAYSDWSLSLKGADFTNANVAMTLDGSPVTITDVYTVGGANSAPEVTLGWIPGVDWHTLDYSVDKTAHVDITNVQVNGSPRSFSYDVILFEPEQTPVDYDHFIYLPMVVK